MNFTPQDYINGFLLFSAVFFWYLVAQANIPNLIKKFQRKRRMKQFINKIKCQADDFLKELQAQGKPSEKQTSELTFRDAKGGLSVVKITVDPALDNIQLDEDDMAQMMADGIGGRGLDLIQHGSEAAKKAANQEEFVFSPKGVAMMRGMGMEPEEIVTKMLKASGRMK